MLITSLATIAALTILAGVVLSTRKPPEPLREIESEPSCDRMAISDFDRFRLATFDDIPPWNDPFFEPGAE